MNAKPRSSLKKRSGVQDDRRVSFASPLASDNIGLPHNKKQLPITKSSKAGPVVAKKSKPADDLSDIISLVNKQSDVIEDMFEIENKFGKQSTMAQNLSIELTNFIEDVATLSSNSTKVKSQLEEQSTKLESLETNLRQLAGQANAICVKYESRISAQNQYSSYLLELQKFFSCINCSKLERPENSKMDYDGLLTLVDQLETCVGEF